MLCCKSALRINNKNTKKHKNTCDFLYIDLQSPCCPLKRHMNEYYATYNQRLIEILPDHWKSSGVHMNRYYLKAAWYFKERKLACSLYKGHVKSSMKNFRVKYGKKNCASKQCPLSSIFTLYPCDGHGILSNIFPTVRISFLFFFFFFFFFWKIIPEYSYSIK